MLEYLFFFRGDIRALEVCTPFVDKTIFKDKDWAVWAVETENLRLLDWLDVLGVRMVSGKKYGGANIGLKMKEGVLKYLSMDNDASAEFADAWLDHNNILSWGDILSLGTRESCLDFIDKWIRKSFHTRNMKLLQKLAEMLPSEHKPDSGWSKTGEISSESILLKLWKEALNTSYSGCKITSDITFLIDAGLSPPMLVRDVNEKTPISIFWHVFGRLQSEIKCGSAFWLLENEAIRTQVKEDIISNTQEVFNFIRRRNRAEIERLHSVHSLAETCDTHGDNLAHHWAYNAWITKDCIDDVIRLGLASWLDAKNHSGESPWDVNGAGESNLETKIYYERKMLEMASPPSTWGGPGCLSVGRRL